ncbi:MAG: LytTR family transcriptional regulator DNA-binding domain-containing protein [Eubacterium sp.]
MENRYVDVKEEGKVMQLAAEDILYVLMECHKPEIHLQNGKKYACRYTLEKVEEMLGDSFLKVSRKCLISVRAIHAIKDQVILSNGEKLSYSPRNKNMILQMFHEKQKNILNQLTSEKCVMTEKQYWEHYRCFDHMPFAFTDIEMIFDDDQHAIDWIFRYGNKALAELEKIPLDQLIGKAFGSIFANMDPKWLRSYEQAALYGKTLEIIDYSPEIDTYIQVTCFPTFPGHCGCILKDITKIHYVKGESGSPKALLMYLGRLLKAQDN